MWKNDMTSGCIAVLHHGVILDSEWYYPLWTILTGCSGS